MFQLCFSYNTVFAISVMDIISRAGWNARDPRNIRFTVAEEIFLHHSVGAPGFDRDFDGDMGDDYMRAMQNYHMDSKGWDDIAYNFAIDPDGLEVYEGRGWGVRPGAQKSYNANTWAVVIMGNFSKREPSEALLRRIAELVRFGQSLGHLPEAALQGHQDAPAQSTTCPGVLLYTQLNTINEYIEEDNMPISDDDAKKIAGFVWADYLINGRHANTILRDINGDTDAIRDKVSGLVINVDIDALAAALLAKINLIQAP